MQRGVFGLQNISYTSFNITYDYYIDGMARPNTISLIAYSDGASVNFILNKNSGAQTLLRQIMNYSRRGEIIPSLIPLTSSFFVWLIQKVYLNDVCYEGADGFLVNIESIIGFRGNTADSITTITASGDSVMNTLGTLGFLLDSKTFTQEKVRLSYGDHQNVELKIGTTSNGVIEADVKTYLGRYKTDQCDKYEIFDKLYLLTYLEIVPTLIQWYYEEQLEDISDQQAKVDFLQTVADDITQKIRETKLSLTGDIVQV